MAADFGADVAGVRRLVPTITIDPASIPSESDVEALIAESTGTVARELGDLAALTPVQTEDVNAGARGLVHLAVAATVFDAQYPERSGETGQSYGTVLWARYKDGLSGLVMAVQGLTESNSPGAGGTPVGYFPPPAFPDAAVY